MPTTPMKFMSGMIVTPKQKGTRYVTEEKVVQNIVTTQNATIISI